MAPTIVQDGPHGNQSPQNFSFRLSEGEQITKVIVRHGYIVDAIGFVVAGPNGTRVVTYGGDLGHEESMIMNCGEFITKISGTSGEYSYSGNARLISTLKIHTNICPEGYGPFGAGRSTQNAWTFESPFPVPGRVVGFFGHSQNYLFSLGLYFEKSQCQPQFVTTVYITNETNTSPLRLERCEDWKGSKTSEYASIIEDNQTIELSHRGDSNGSMGAVIYVGSTTKTGTQEDCGWLVAWYIPGGGRQNHVYVDSGPIDKFEGINWHPIKRQLEHSVPTRDYTHPRNGARVKATVNGSPAANGNYEIEVYFGVVKN